MIRLLFRSTIRSVMQNKLLTALKAFALCGGAATFLLTSLFYLHEWRYDRQHQDYDRIYRYVHQIKTGEMLESLALAAATVGPALKERFPEVDTYTRLVFPPLSVRNVATDVLFNERRFGFADPAFLEIFNFPVRGNNSAEGLLGEPNSVILTPAMATKYFGSLDVVGKTLLVNGETEFVVKGMFEQNPELSHMHFDFIASFSSLDAIKNNPILASQIPLSKQTENKGIAAFYNYIRLTPGASPDDLVAKFPAFIEATRGVGRSEKFKPTLQSVASIHLNSNLIYEIQPNGSKSETYIYLTVGILILGIACINYINTSTAEFMKRERDIGLKKILGASRGMLMTTHLFETCMIAIIGLVAGLGVAILALPEFNAITSRTLRADLREITAIVVSLLVFIVIVSGILPAMKIAGIAPHQVLKGNKTVRPGSFSGRTVLVFIQVVCSFTLLTLSLLLYNQFNFLLKRDVGFDAKNVLVINALTADPLKRISLRDQFLNEPGVSNVALCSSPPGRSFASLGIRYKGKADDDEQTMSAWQTFVDQHYLETLRIGISTGRFFDEKNAADTSDYLVLNSAGATVLGGDVIDKKLNIPVLFKNRRTDKSIAGIVTDFHFASLHHPVEPLLLEYNPERCGYMLLRLDNSDFSKGITSISARWKETFPTIPFDYWFLEDDVALLYGKESRQKDMLMIISGISIVLTALGIFGTTLFLSEARTKEMGIRKALGSERIELLSLLFRPTFVILLVACLVASPLIAFAGEKWLEQYPYRTTFSPLLYLVAFAIILVIMVVTVLNHFLRVTRVNPVDVLRENG